MASQLYRILTGIIYVNAHSYEWSCQSPQSIESDVQHVQTERDRARSGSYAMLTGGICWHCVECHSVIECSKITILKISF